MVRPRPGTLITAAAAPVTSIRAHEPIESRPRTFSTTAPPEMYSLALDEQKPVPHLPLTVSEPMSMAPSPELYTVSAAFTAISPRLCDCGTVASSADALRPAAGAWRHDATWGWAPLGSTVAIT